MELPIKGLQTVRYGTVSIAFLVFVSTLPEVVANSASFHRGQNIKIQEKERVERAKLETQAEQEIHKLIQANAYTYEYKEIETEKGVIPDMSKVGVPTSPSRILLVIGKTKQKERFCSGFVVGREFRPNLSPELHKKCEDVIASLPSLK